MVLKIELEGETSFIVDTSDTYYQTCLLGFLFFQTCYSQCLPLVISNLWNGYSFLSVKGGYDKYYIVAERKVSTWTFFVSFDRCMTAADNS